MTWLHTDYDMITHRLWHDYTHIIQGLHQYYEWISGGIVSVSGGLVGAVIMRLELP